MRAARAANTELLSLYWSIGRDILERQETTGWGVKIIDRLAADLHAAFPSSVAGPVATCSTCAPWPPPGPARTSRNVLLHDFPGAHHRPARPPRRPGLRGWYAAAATEQAWSRNVLEHQIATRLHQRLGAASSNFTAQLPPVDSTWPSS
ncbi:DUF1016 N-terminal domain-containing protein [Kineococcus rubinsiae]|uniref:DUF1016 N-terminal domain-containing protein n=1 Tax=Kineococcus rubinsiae TaxID=2609562 RepID=UPI001AD92CC3